MCSPASTEMLTACVVCFSLSQSQVLETHIFHSFLRDRLNRKWDAFSRMEQNTRNLVHRYDVSMMSLLVSTGMLINIIVTHSVTQMHMGSS